MPYIVAVEIDIDFPGLELERTFQFITEADLPPTYEEISSQVEGLIPELTSAEFYHGMPPMGTTFTFTFTIEAIFHVTPLE